MTANHYKCPPKRVLNPTRLVGACPPSGCDDEWCCSDKLPGMVHVGGDGNGGLTATQGMVVAHTGETSRASDEGSALIFVGVCGGATVIGVSIAFYRHFTREAALRHREMMDERDADLIDSGFGAPDNYEDRAMADEFEQKRAQLEMTDVERQVERIRERVASVEAEEHESP